MVRIFKVRVERNHRFFNNVVNLLFQEINVAVFDGGQLFKNI